MIIVICQSLPVIRQRYLYDRVGAQTWISNSDNTTEGSSVCYLMLLKYYGH